MIPPIADLFLCFIEYFTVYIFLENTLPRRYNSHLPMIFTAVTNALFIFLITDFSWGKIILCIFTITFCSLVLYKSKLYINSAFAVTFLYIFCSIDVAAGNILSVVLDKQFMEVIYSDVVYWTITCFVIKLIDIIAFILLYLAFKKSGIDIERRSWILFNIVMAVFMFITVFYMEVYPTTTQDTSSALLYTVVSIAFLTMSFIVMYFFTSICADFKKNETLFLLEASHKSMEEKLIMQTQNMERLHKIRHDIRNHLINAKQLIESGNSGTATGLLSEIIGQTDRITLDIPVLTGCSVIDSIIAYKTAVCENRNIKLKCELSLLPEINIDYADISSVIANLADNAISAAEKSENPHITVKISEYGSYISIFVKNSCPAGTEITVEDGKPVTTKAQKELHGFGIKIIEEIAHKYDGSYSWKLKNNDFIASVLLKNVKRS